MAKLNSLPQELIDGVCDSLTRNDILALRHTDRQLAKKTQKPFASTFDTIAVTCSRASLLRLNKILVHIDDTKDLLARVKSVTLHTLTPYQLEVLAGSMNPGAVSEYIRTYAYMRKTLVNGLNALPNLETITIDQHPINGIVDPAVDWHDSTRFDPIIDAFQPLPPALDTFEPDFDTFPPPQVYGLEAALSVFHDLVKQDDITLNLIIDTSQTGISLEDPSGTYASAQLLRLHGTHPTTAHQLLNVYAQMFGRSGVDFDPSAMFGGSGINFDPSAIIRAHLKTLTIIGDPQATDTPTGLRGIVKATAGSPMTDLAFKNINPQHLMEVALGFLVLAPRTAVISRFSYVDTDVTHFPVQLFRLRGRIFRAVEFRGCEAPPLRWSTMLNELATSETLNEFSIVDCTAACNGQAVGIHDENWVGHVKVVSQLRNLAVGLQMLRLGVAE